MEWTLRRAVPADAPRVEALFLEMLRSIFPGTAPQGYAPGDLDRFFAGGEDWICVAEAAGEVVGFLSIESHRETPPYLYLDDFSVSGPCRNQGIGTALLGAAEQYAEEIGVSAVLLHVEKSNAAARRLYERRGYTLFRDDGHRLLLMKRMFELRELSPADREPIKALFLSVFSAPPWNDDWSAPGQLDAYIADLTENRNSLTLGFFAGDRLVALAMGHIRHWFQGTEYTIDELCVARDRQGQGVGSRFLEAVEQHLGERGIYRVFLQTDRGVPAYRFYQRRGFTELTEHVSFAKELPNGGSSDAYGKD